MKKTALSAFALLLMAATSLTAQENKYYTPQKGDWSIGVVFNPVSMSSIKAQPSSGDKVGDWAKGHAFNGDQMFMLSQDPVAAVRVKYRLDKNAALRASLGFNGSLINYKEYVQDDLAVALDADSQNKVVDVVHSNMNTASLMLGYEYMVGEKAVRFIFGGDILYSIGGGRLTFDYGNRMTSLNQIPSTMPIPGDMKDESGKGGIAYGRPTDKYTAGYIHALGFSLEMGIEVFIAERISAGLSMNFTPLAVTFQPETYTVYEGFSTYTGQVEKYTNYVSPGSNALLYGIENFGARLSLNYYF